jgi:DNA repair protein RecO (recombination protein O)
MAAEKTTGIVLRVIAFSETSCIVTLMTREFGKITAIAKGARRPKSPFEAALDVLAICRIVFLDKSSGAMSLLTEAKLERRFRSSATNLKRLYAGYYIIELLNSLTDDGDSNPALFDLAVETIARVDSDDIDESQLNETLLRFELRLLELLGHLPMLTKCVSCGREKTSLTKVSFGLNSGGILCQACCRGKSNIVSLSSDGLQFLLGIVGGQVGADHLNSDNWNGSDGTTEQTDWDRGSHSKTDSMTPRVVDQTNCLGEARRLVNKYITHLLGFPPKLHKFLKNI